MNKKYARYVVERFLKNLEIENPRLASEITIVGFRPLSPTKIRLKVNTYGELTDKQRRGLEELDLEEISTWYLTRLSPGDAWSRVSYWAGHSGESKRDEFARFSVPHDPSQEKYLIKNPTWDDERRTATIYINAGKGHVRAARSIVSQAIQNALHHVKHNEEPHHLSYMGDKAALEAGDAIAGGRYYIDVTDHEISAIRRELKQLTSDEWDGIPVDIYHD